MAYQSLYRRYRPDKFSEIVGQPHVVKALQNAVRENRVGHAYLFSGPRGTGKTSTARIMAKALNCTDLGADGEPCNACESCQAFIAGTSYDLHELDAASNNGVEAVRDLIAKVALGSPGRTKVYILDEVHMLTSGAENALLKTLEEPPEHVKFVLATTEPHKVVPTIRSRTQHLQFELISSAELSDHIRFIAADAGLDIDDEIVNHVVRDGGGSARDALSALDQVIAAGGSRGDDTSVIEIVEAIAASDSGRAIAAVDAALRAGREPRVIGEAVLARLRETFLAVVGADLGQLPEIDRDRALDLASRVGPARVTRALEMLGTALVDMRQAPDPRVDLEVALVRLTRVDLDTDVAALVQRIEHLEQGATTPTQPPMPSRPENEASAAAAIPTESPSPSPSPASPEAPTTRPPSSGGPADMARRTLAAKTTTPAVSPESPDQAATPSPAPAAAPAEQTTPPVGAATPTIGAVRRQRGQGAPNGGSMTEEAEAAPPAVDEPIEGSGSPSGSATTVPTPAQVEAAWTESILPELSNRARARFNGGSFVERPGAGVVFALPNQIHRDRCQEVRGDVDAALESTFGQRVPFEIIVDGSASSAGHRGAAVPSPGDRAEDETIELDDLIDAPADEKSGIERLTQAFPGAEVLDTDQP